MATFPRRLLLAVVLLLPACGRSDPHAGEAAAASRTAAATGTSATAGAPGAPPAAPPGRPPPLALPDLRGLSPARLDSLLAALHDALPRFEDRLRALALDRVGVPYALGTLGEEAPPDSDPVFRLDEADCTVLVLTTTALAHARSLAEARAWMGPANYHRRGAGFPVTYANRLHFTSDRITGSPLFADLTATVSRPEERRRVELVLNRTASGAELLPLGWQRPLVIEYVPVEHLEPVLARLPSLVGVAFVRERLVERGLLVAHEGLLLDGHRLVHASSRAGAVVAVDLLDYLWRRDDPEAAGGGAPRFDGVLIYAIRDASQELSPPPIALPAP